MSNKPKRWPKSHPTGSRAAIITDMIREVESYFTRRGAESPKILHINFESHSTPLFTVEFRAIYRSARFRQVKEMGHSGRGEIWKGVNLHGLTVRWAEPHTGPMVAESVPVTRREAEGIVRIAEILAPIPKPRPLSIGIAFRPAELDLALAALPGAEFLQPVHAEQSL